MLQFSSRLARSWSGTTSRHLRATKPLIEELEPRTLLSATPTGLVDVFNRTQISGWAFDKDDGSAPINVEITINGVKTTVSANPNQADVPASLGSLNHGFTFTMPVLPPGNSNITIVEVSPSTGVRRTLRTGTLTNPLPQGKVELLSATEIKGWMYDSDSTNPIQMRIDIDGVMGTPFTTNVARTDLASRYHVQNLGFDVTGDFAGHVVEVYAYDAPSDVPVLIYTNNKLPKGKVEINNGSVVTGWAQDPDSPTASIEVRVAIDGVMMPGDPITADLTRTDLVKSLGSANHGFSIVLPGLSPGPHTIAVYAIDGQANSAKPVLLGQSGIGTASPTGAVDVFTRTQIAGWAYDRDDGSGPMEIQITINGVTTTIAADQNQADVPANLGSPYHGFSYTMPVLPPGNSSVTVVEVSPTTGAKRTLRSGTITNPPPVTHIDKITATEIVGWAYDPDSTNPIQMRIDIDGVAGTPFTTNVARTDLASRYHVQNMGFDVTGDFAGHEIEIYAYDAPSGTAKLIYTNNKPPKGKLEVANGLIVSGWAQDPDAPTASINVLVTIDGVTLPGTPTLANGTRNDLVKSLGSANHGFSIAIPGLTPGKHTIAVYAIDGEAQSAAPVLLGRVTVTNNPPVGHVDTLNSSVVSGWALDPDLGAQPTTVHVYVDETLYATTTANVSRPTLTGKSANHGFSVDLSTLPAGSHSITVTAMDDRASDQNEVVIYDGFINNQIPQGNVDPITGTQVTGWAYDPDAGTNPIPVDIYVDGVYSTTVTANLSGSDVAANLPSPNHAFAANLPELSYGTHKITVYAAESQGNVSVLIGTQLVTNHRPIGFMESADGTTITGWAVDPDAMGHSVALQVWINGVQVLPQNGDPALLANVTRSDLLSSTVFSNSPGGFANYGFNITLPTLNAGNNYITVYAVDANNGMLEPIGSELVVV